MRSSLRWSGPGEPAPSCSRTSVCGAPFGPRAQRQLKFAATVWKPDGTSHIVELSGPSSYETWLKCWLVFRTACIMCRVATSAALDRYQAMFQQRVERFPNCWHILVVAEARFRSEEWPAMLRANEEYSQMNPSMSTFDRSMPWECVIRASCTTAGADSYWEREVTIPCLQYERGGHRASHAFQQPRQLALGAEQQQQRQPVLDADG